MSALEVWKQRVAAHHAQSRKIRAALGIAAVDRWEVVSPLFKANPRRTDDVEVNRLVREVAPAMTVLDVGGGAGRYALPLALWCQHVTVVEPSPSMGKSLRQTAAKAGIDNVSLDVVLSAHVIYMVEDIRAFVGKLVAHARQKVLMPTFMRPPMARYSPFWRAVHGEDRQELPGARELMQVLWELDIYPHLEMFDPRPPRVFKDWQGALETLRERIHVKPDTAEDARLQRAMREQLIETPDGYAIRGAIPERLALISWQPKYMTRS
jgi:SAM-dependent methyltransferase